jgi:Spy/CpxP family protein refolding chaperone
MSTDVLAATRLPRPAERVAILSLLLVFLCGAVLGAVVMSYWVHPGLHGSRPGGDGLSMSIREWKEELNLTDDQTRQLTSILDDFSLMYSNLLSDGNTRIVQILNPEQRKKFDRMMAEHKKQQP